MSYLRILGGLAGCAALIGIVAWAVATFHKAQAVDGYRACSKAAKSASAPLTDCDATIKALVTAARASAACDAALEKDPVDLFGASTSCAAGAKRLIARATAAEGSLADANAQLAGAKVDRDAAVLRAEARATSIAARKAANDRTIEAAPRTDAGLVHCDAECLHALAD